MARVAVVVQLTTKVVVQFNSIRDVQMMHKTPRAQAVPMAMRTSGESVRSGLFARILGLLSLAFLMATYTSQAIAQSCGARQWAYDLADLQEARRRLKSPSIQTPNARVTCADSILSSPRLTSPMEECKGCAQEYVGLLADSAVLMREAAEGGANREAYVAKEVKTRLRLHEFLEENKEWGPRDRYLQSNLLALADAMERAGDASQYHQFISGLNDSDRSHIQLNRVWVKAVRSCSVWDFKSVENLAQLRKNLCTDDCKTDLVAVYEGLGKANLIGANGEVRTSLPKLPVPARCE